MKWIVLLEKPSDELPPILVMGVAEEGQIEQVKAWVGENDRRYYYFTEKLA